MRIAIFGSGGVGGYFGGRLAEAGEDVRFVARGAHLAAMREHGLRVSSVAGDFVVRPVRASDDPASLGEVDVVLLAVKAWQVADAAAAMRPLLSADTFVVPLQNGIEAPDTLATVLGRARVLGGLCQIIAYVVEPGHVRHAGVAPLVAFGELHAPTSQRAERLCEAFAQARGLRVKIVADVRAAMWEKFLFIAAVSGVGALAWAPVGIIRSQAETRELLVQALKEIHTVARAHDIALAADAVEKTLAFVDTLPADGTVSMQRDFAEGRPSELEAQIGAVVRLGEARGIAVPLHRMIYAALLPLERRARGALDFS
ncbi:MAG: 2-dehydropantoate 2-reductase [Gemmatimonadales bacterium]|nr:2-dehydropantoate 2-reductase [Gemmatimonadales bacterium]